MADFKPVRNVYGEPSPEYLAVRDIVLELAAGHAAGHIDHWGIRRQCTGHDRHIATLFTPTDHPDYLALMALLDELIATDPTQEGGWHYQTRQGGFCEADLRAAGAQMVKDGAGRVGFRFPVRIGANGPEFQTRGENVA